MDIDPYKIFFYAVLGTVVVIVSIVRFSAGGMKKRQSKRIKVTVKHSSKKSDCLLGCIQNISKNYSLKPPGSWR